jgi:hypothetical protein
MTKRPPTYQQRAKSHLSSYKRKRLGVRARGVWLRNGRPYPHILPQPLYQLNILETIRTQFFGHLSHREALHRDFHHLTSSQALCFNFFFPFVGLTGVSAEPLFRALRLPLRSIQDSGFEHVPDAEEGTNFDFWMTDGADEIFVEVKFTEGGFGRAKVDAKHLDKLEKIYRPRLEDKVRSEALDPPIFCANYQLLRNVAYTSPNAYSVFLLPRANDKLHKGIEFLQEVLRPAIKRRVRVIYLEDALQSLLTMASKLPPIAAAHQVMMVEKYLVPEAALLPDASPFR